MEKPTSEPGKRTLAAVVPIDPAARGTELRLEPVQRNDQSVSFGCASAKAKYEP